MDILTSNDDNDNKIKIIGIGKYSCVINKPITNVVKEYIIYDNIYYTDVSKIFKLDYDYSFDEEYEMIQKIKEIDCDNDFTLSVKGISTFNSTEIKDNKIIKYLNIKKDTILKQIILEYGGVPVFNIQEYILFKDFLKTILKLFKGIKKMHDNNIIHRDIKPYNVLYKNYKFNLIDFGLTCNIDEVYCKDNFDNFTSVYMYYPPEYYIAYLLYDKEDFDTKHNVSTKNNFKYNFNIIMKPLIVNSLFLQEYYNEHYYAFNKKEPYNILTYINGFKSFYNYVMNNDKINSIADLFTNDFAYKLDIYGLSFVIKELKKNIFFKYTIEKKIYNQLFNMCYNLNPFERSTINNIISFIEDNI